MKYLITGAAGLIGRFLIDRLARDDHEVVAWILPHESLGNERRAEHVTDDLLDEVAVAGVLDRTAPDVIVHLAAQSFPVRSWEKPSETMRINYESTANLLQALRAAGAPKTRLMFASSSDIYASSKDGTPISEEAQKGPGSPYGVSKLACDALVQLYARAFALDTICFRPFFLIGPEKRGDVASDFARRVVAIERGAPALLKTGRTNMVRDMVDVRDGVEAIVVLAERGETANAYNICTGAGHTVGDVLEYMKKAAGVRFETDIDPAFLRPVDEPVRVGDATKIMALGWKPAITFERTVQDILEYWRKAES